MTTTLARCRNSPPCVWEIETDEARQAHVEDEHLDRCPQRFTPSGLEAKRRASRTHGKRRRLLKDPAVPLAQMATAAWHTRALEALRQLATTGATFTIYDIAEAAGEPLNPKSDWGTLAKDAAHLGIIAHARDAEGHALSVPSPRTTANGSLVSLWTRGKAIA